MKGVLAISLLALLVLTACIPTVPTEVHIIEKLVPLSKGTYEDFSLDTTEVTSFTDEDEYISFTKRYQNSYYPRYGGVGMAVDFAFAEEAVDSVALNTVASAKVADVDGGDYSTTNNQVATVDEADIMKTDGEYVYTSTDDDLFIISREAELLSTIDLDGHIHGFFIDGNSLVVFATGDIHEHLGFAPQNSFTFVYFYDIADRENPELSKEVSIEGSYYTARLHEGEIYLVAQSSPEYRPIYPLPIIYDGAVREIAVSDIIYYPQPYRSPQMVGVHKLSLTDEEVSRSLLVSVDNVQTVYVSEDNLYVVGREYVDEYEIQQQVIRDMLENEISQKDKSLIKAIKEINDEILSHSEKENKIQQVYSNHISRMSVEEQEEFYDDVEIELKNRLESYEYFEYSNIIKVGLDDVTLVAQGKIPGSAVNQFSLDEHDGALRMATIINQRWSRFDEGNTESQSHVYILDESLTVSGSLVGIAPTERIYSTRFVDDRLYMVTFRQVDPFFVIDLSNEKKPAILGELKIPGFSRYLHPYDENHIIGIGEDATDTGRTTGLKISLFDVTDVSEPVEVASYVGEDRYAGSTALYEHKAFLFSKAKELLVIPVYYYNWQERDESYSGAFVFSINEEEINLRGLIDHNSLGSEWAYGSQVERSLYIEDELYTKSPELLRVNALDNLRSLHNLTLVGSKDVDFPIY